MKLRIYNLIKEYSLKYNSIDLGRIMNITDAEVRAYIKEINEDLRNFEYGIISKGNKYKLAIEGDDFKNKVMYYRQMHKTATKQEQLWLRRQDKVSMKKQDGYESAGEVEFNLEEPLIEKVIKSVAKELGMKANITFGRNAPTFQSAIYLNWFENKIHRTMHSDIDDTEIVIGSIDGVEIVIYAWWNKGIIKEIKQKIQHLLDKEEE